MSRNTFLNRRHFCGTAAATVAAYPLGLIAQQEVTDATAIRPFRVNFSEADLDELRKRINATRWPDRETVNDNSQGVPLAMLQGLATYWAAGYDWRKCEAKLNALPQFLTEIDGLDIHFIHVRSKYEHALPLIVTHGWPGSIIEQLKIIEPLTNPTAYGGSAADAFHIVIPSIPGYGFSGRPTVTGWGTDHTARAWVVLMKRLGYTHFVAQGGDIGSVVTTLMAEQAPPGLLGMHTSLPATVPRAVAKSLSCGDPAPAGLSADEKHAYAQLQLLYGKQFAYAAVMHTRPQTLYGLADSPVGLAAWLLDHGDGWGQPAAAVVSAVAGHTVDGHTAGALTRDDVLDNITVYWLTNTAVSAARSYWENKTSPLNAANVTIPAAATVFPGEIYEAPHSWTRLAFHNLIYFHKAAQGGHFAAWEQPQIFSEELRAGFRTLRRNA
ncbi:MAG: alpha/beta fold hydrolase [Candidatus Eremiobacteraeota bacterium]|nr:alpha/beta fold hydrolase [Candidatus Eremiobacteraeota bacterium]